MKIVFDSLVFALHEYGGVVTYWNEFIARFRQDGADLSILVVPANKYLNQQFVEMAKSGLHCIPEQRRPLQWLRNTSPRISSVAERFIFHSNYLRVSSNRNAVNILTIHDFTHQHFVKGLRGILNFHQKRRAILKADGIVCISENTRRDLLRFFPAAKQKPLRVVHNGCSEGYLDPSRLEPVVTTPAPYILFVGARGGYKNFTFMLEILKASHYQLVVAGAGLNEDEAALVSDFRGRITVLENVSDQSLKSLYQHAHAFVYPSLYEGFGIPLLEAMNCGCPVIAFSNSCIPEIMGDSPMLLKNNDLPGVLHMLKEIETNGNFRQLVINKQREQAGNFSWARAYNEMKDFYQQMLEASA